MQKRYNTANPKSCAMKKMGKKSVNAVAASFFILTITIIYSCAKVGIGGPSFLVDGVANGAQVVPSSVSSATGQLSGTFDGSKNTMKAVVKWTGLSGSPTAIHIHAALPGKNGYPYFVLVNVPKGINDSINFTSAFTEALEAGVSKGSYYFDIHTSAFPNGEIRGQIVAH
ncbi:MAG: CHRD domain-containing protein [Bacteroidetes bacterium]|nr:CHRD domain-containing protein [Bacteroidota bacterium]